MEELETFTQENKHKRVLLFPPLPSRLRYLIHKTVEDLPQLSTFSVGESWCRRVVVCFSEIRGEVKDDSDLESHSLCKDLKGNEEEEVKPKRSALKNRTPRRPDQPLYLPRAVRQRLSEQNSNQGSAFTSPEAEKSSLTDRVAADCPPEEKLNLSGAEEVWDEPLCEMSALTLEDGVKENGYDSDVPHSSHSENTGLDSETEELTEEMKPHLKHGLCVSIDPVHGDFSCYESVSVSTEDFGHVIEIYDFPAVLKTDDLLDAFTEYSDGGMKIVWVDNTHALGIFSCEAAALHALSLSHPLLKTRALSEGSKKAKGKALRRAEFLQPVKERPRTDCAVARRMVTRALGLQVRGRGRRY